MTCVKSVHVYENECLLYVGALLGVWGIVPVCVPGWLMRVICCGGVCLLVGVLCENCIVDASIKHALDGLHLCGLFVCVCVISFFFS